MFRLPHKDTQEEGWQEIYSSLHEDDQRDIGSAFANSLVPSVAGGISGLTGALESAGLQAPVKIKNALLSRSDVVAGGPEAARLAAFGVTPTDIALAANSVGLLLERAIDAEYFGMEGDLTLTFNRGSVKSAMQTPRPDREINRQTMVEVVMTHTKLGRKKSEILLDWLANVSRSVPGVFSGFIASPSPDDVRLKYLEGNYPDVTVAWKAPKADR